MENVNRAREREFFRLSHSYRITEEVLSKVKSYFENWEHSPVGAANLRDNFEDFLDWAEQEYPMMSAEKVVAALPNNPAIREIKFEDLKGQPHAHKRMADRFIREATVSLWMSEVHRVQLKLGLEPKLPSVEHVKQRVRLLMDPFKAKTFENLASNNRSVKNDFADVWDEYDLPTASYAVPFGYKYGNAIVAVIRAFTAATISPISVQRGLSFGLEEYQLVLYEGKQFFGSASEVLGALPDIQKETLFDFISAGEIGEWFFEHGRARFFLSTRPSSPNNKKGGQIVVMSMYSKNLQESYQ